MSTLPRLPGKYRNGFSISQTQPAPKTFQETFQKRKTTSSKLQNVKDAALRRYEEYLSEVWKTERSFTTQLKKTEQQANRDMGRFADTVAALKLELKQLDNQSDVLKRKVGALKKKREEMTGVDLQRIITPIEQNFRDFDEEFQISMQNVDVLFNNLSSCVKGLKKEYLGLQSVPSEVEAMGKDIEKLKATLKQNDLDLFTAQEQLSALIIDEKNGLVQRLDDRMKGLDVRIETLQKRSKEAFSQSQGVMIDSHNSQSGIRKLFTGVIDTIKSSFKSDIDSLKREISELLSTQVGQMEGVRNRVESLKGKLVEKRRNDLKRIHFQQGNEGRKSLRQEIKALETQCEKLEHELELKQQTKKDDLMVRCFLSVQDDGHVEVLLVDSQGFVYV